MPRLEALYEILAPTAQPWKLAGLARALLPLADEGADALLLPLVRGELTDALWSTSFIGDALFVRDVPLTALFPDLWRLDRESEAERSADEDSAPASRALWLLAKWNAPGARDALARRLRERCGSSFARRDASLDELLSDELRAELAAQGIEIPIEPSDPGEAKFRF